MAFDLILKGGRIIDLSHSLDRIADIGFAAGKVAKIGPDLAGIGRPRSVYQRPRFRSGHNPLEVLCLGMPLADVIAATTVNAAMALKRPELGSLKPGSIGDATILSVQQGTFDYVDVVGEHMVGDKRIVSAGVVIAGHWWHPRGSSKFGRT